MEKDWEELRTGPYLKNSIEVDKLPALPPHLYWDDGWWFAGFNYGKDDLAKVMATEARDSYYL